MRLAYVLIPFSIAWISCSNDRAVPAPPALGYEGYAWPVAQGCTQRPQTYVNFADHSRKRPNGTWRAHLGIDIIPPPPDGNVYVAKDGIVAASSPARGNGWGNYVIVQHADGLRTVYGHLVKPSRLVANQKVAQGDLIGTAGQTETYYVHVHFEVLSATSSEDWTKGRLDPLSVVGPVGGCRVSAVRARKLNPT